MKAKQKLIKFIGECIDESKAIDNMVKFANKHYIMLSTSVEEYESKEIRKNAVIGATLYRLGSLITALRFFMSSVFNNKTMIGIMCDPNYLVTNQRVFSMIISLAALTILFIGLLLQINEMKYKVKTIIVSYIYARPDLHPVLHVMMKTHLWYSVQVKFGVNIRED